MRILLLTDSRECGGVERHLIGVAHELHQRGHRLELATTGARALAPFHDALRPLLNAPPRPLVFESPGEWRTAFRLAFRLLTKTDALVVSAHSTLSCYYPLWLATQLKRPSVLIQQLIDPLAEIDAATRERRSRHLRSCRSVVAVSEAVRQTLQSLFDLRETNPAVVPNGADCERFTPGRALRPGVEAPLLCVARLSPQKGLDVLLHALEPLVREFPWLRLEIAGSGPKRAALEALRRELKLEEHIRFLGEVGDVPSFLSRGRVLVLPSLEEGLPLALAEGMASGLVTVATSVGGTPELVEDGETGFLVPPSDADALSNALRRAIQLPLERLTAMGLRGRERVLERFDAKAGARAIAQLVEQETVRQSQVTE